MLEGVMLLWFLLAGISLLFVAIDIRATPESPVLKWGFVLLTTYTGVFGSFLYVLGCREPLPRRHERYVGARWRQTLGSTMHCVAGDGVCILAGAVLQDQDADAGARATRRAARIKQPWKSSRYRDHHASHGFAIVRRPGRWLGDSLFGRAGVKGKQMSADTAADAKSFDVAYLVLSGTTTAARCPELLRGLVGLGFSTVIAIPTPNASRVVAPRDLAEVDRVQVVQSYFDLAIRPRPPRRVVLFAPCSFNSLNKLAHGIADNLALSVVAEAIGRSTPVIVGPSLNAPLLGHPEARASLKRLPTWGVLIVPPVDDGEGPRLAPSPLLIDAVRPYVRRG